MKTRPWAIGKRLADFVCRHRQVQSNTPFAHWRAAAAVGLLHAALLVPVAAAQPIPVYPAGPPWRPVPSDEFQGRDLREELKNKMTDTFTVTSVGDMYWQSPVAKRMSPQLRDVMRNADTTVGNLEGGVGFDPEATASAMVDLGLDFAGARRVWWLAGAADRRAGAGQIRDQAGRCRPQPGQCAPAGFSGTSPGPRGISPRLPGRQSLRASRHEHGTRGEPARRHGVEHGDEGTIRSTQSDRGLDPRAPERARRSCPAPRCRPRFLRGA